MDWFERLISFVENTNFFQKYASKMPAPLDNATFDSVVLLVIILILLRMLIGKIIYMARSRRIIKYRKLRDQEEELKNPNLKNEEADRKLMTDWIKLQIANEMKEMAALEAADFDELTGLPTRKAYRKKLDDLIAEGDSYAIVFFDINFLKMTNDTYGHAKGDLLLTTIVDELKNHFETLYRCGGDEFNAIIPLRKFDPDVFKVIDDKLAKITHDRNDGIIYETAHGYALNSEAATPSDVLAIADGRMYEDKKRKKAAHADIKWVDTRISPENQDKEDAGKPGETLA